MGKGFVNHFLFFAAHFSAAFFPLVVELWLHRVADDVSGLTFQEWDPGSHRSACVVRTQKGSDDTSAPVAMIVNSSELRAADFPVTEVRPLQLDAVARGGRRARARQ